MAGPSDHAAVIGKLRHRLTIQSETKLADDGGGYTLGWADVVTVWGAIKPLSGGEQLRAMQLQDKVSHRIRIRHRSGVTPKQRLLFGSRAFQIRAVLNPDERNRWLESVFEPHMLNVNVET